MSRREKIVLGLMGVAVLAGAINMLGRGKPASKSGETTAQVKARVAAFIEASRASLRASEPNEAALTAEMQRKAPWTINPFSHGAGSAEPAPVQRLAVVYSGLLVLGSEERAVLNGRTYGVGDLVRQAGVRVVDIRKDEVDLVSINGEETVTVKLAKPRRERGRK